MQFNTGHNEQIKDYLKARVPISVLSLVVGTGIFTVGVLASLDQVSKNGITMLGSTFMTIGLISIAYYFMFIALKFKSAKAHAEEFDIEKIKALQDVLFCLIAAIMLCLGAGIGYGGVHHGLNTLIPQAGFSNIESKLIEFGLGLGLGFVVSGLFIIGLATNKVGKANEVDHELAQEENKYLYTIHSSSRTRDIAGAVLRAIYYGAATGLSSISGSLITDAIDVSGETAIVIEVLFAVMTTALAVALDLMFTKVIPSARHPS